MSKSSKTCYMYLSTVLTLLLLTIWSLWNHIYWRQIFLLRLSESQGMYMYNLGQICQNSETTIWKPAFGHQPVLCSLIMRAVSANQSACYMAILLYRSILYQPALGWYIDCVSAECLDWCAAYTWVKYWPSVSLDISVSSVSWHHQ